MKNTFNIANSKSAISTQDKASHVYAAISPTCPSSTSRQITYTNLDYISDGSSTGKIPVCLMQFRYAVFAILSHIKPFRVASCLRIISSLFAATVLLAGTMAEAADPDDPRILVRTADLDLATKAGQMLLKRRIHDAVEKLCPPFSALEQLSPAAECRRRAYRKAAMQRKQVVAKAVQTRKSSTSEPNRQPPADHDPQGSGQVSKALRCVSPRCGGNVPLSTIQ